MKKLSIEHRGRELLHVVELLTRCLTIPGSTVAARESWRQGIRRSTQQLQGLYAGGLSRDFHTKGTPPAAQSSRRAIAGGSATGSDRVEKSGLTPWQRELLLRLERGLGRRLKSSDAKCITWNATAHTLSVVARPLLGELRDMNLTSNVFRS
jgi:hypothetical protein